MLYFKNRAEAGRILAKRLAKYRDNDCVVLCLSEGAVVVGAQIAMSLHASMLLYKIKHIFLPNEIEPTAGFSSTGNFRYSDLLSAGEIEEIVAEYHNYLDEQRMQKNHELNVLLGNQGAIDRSQLRHKTIILVADALMSGFAVAMAADYLKTVSVKRIIAAVGVASVSALDQLHIQADEMCVLGVTQNFISEEGHYFEDGAGPDIDTALKIMSNISFAWRDSGQANAASTTAVQHLYT
jgi:predicted phosphoribosyltransferase